MSYSHRAKVAGKKDLISEATIRADLLFDDENGVDCFPKQVIWDLLRDIGYEGNLAQLTFSKPLFSPQWKYLVHVLLHCLSPKSTSWGTFWTNIASALVGLATNQKFNFSLMILTGMLGHISNGLNLCTPSMLEGCLKQHWQRRKNIVLVLILGLQVMRDAQGTPTQSAAHSQRTASVQGTASFHGTATPHDSDAVQENQNLKKQKRRRKKHKKKVSSVKLGRNKDEGTLSEEHNVQEEDTALSEEHNVQEEDTAHPFFDDIVDKDAAVTPDLERKSDETEEVNIEEKEASNVKSGETEELDLETTQSTARQGTITSKGPKFGRLKRCFKPTRPIQVMELKNNLKLMMFLLAILDQENLKEEINSSQIRALETNNDVEVARKIQAEEWDAEEERKRLYSMVSEQRTEMLKEIEKQIRLLRKRKATLSEEQPSKKPNVERTETIDELLRKLFLRVVDFDKEDAQDRGTGFISLYRVVQEYYGDILQRLRIRRMEKSYDGGFMNLQDVHTLELEDGSLNSHAGEEDILYQES
ncbi:hypothetical protein Tco_0008345 [Tanacetum coccineum]